MANITLDLDALLADEGGDGGGQGDDGEQVPSYWRAENHSGADNYLRADNWIADVSEFVLPSGEERTLPLSFEMGQAMLRWREEAKMYANLADQAQGRPDGAPESLLNPAFLDEHHARVLSDWPVSKERGPWFQALEALRTALDGAVRAVDAGNGAFVKLSVRSPKDAVFAMGSTMEMIREAAQASTLAADSPEALSEDIRIIKQATWKAMVVRDGAEALQLLLRSDRIYVDVLQHSLFTAKSTPEATAAAFDLQIHVREFCVLFNPELEFRGFVSKGERTALAAYSPWIYHPLIVDRKAEILAAIERVWDVVQPRIATKSQDYSIDFAVAEDLSQCWVVEINNFLPPLAGAGCFNFAEDPADKDVILNGPFEFRVVERPIEEADFTRVSVNEKTGKTRTRVMKPAPDHVMQLLADIRRPPRSGPGCSMQ